MENISKLKLELLERLLYSPDLASCDYHLFPNLKKILGGRRFQSNEEIIDAVNIHFEELDKLHNRDGLIKLEHRFDKYISFSVDYVKKIKKNNFFSRFGIF